MATTEKIEAAVATTERRWNEEVARTKELIAQAEAEFGAASADYQTACDGDDDKVRHDAYSECMKALGRKDAYAAKLRRLDDPRELERRLTNSRQLAERFR